MLAVEAVHTYYGDSHVLQGVSLGVGPGEAVALLGRNGVGKTTVIRTIVGFTPPRSGVVRFDGVPVSRMPAHEIVRRGIGLVPQGRRIFAPLTVEENLTLGARAPRRSWPGGSTGPRPTPWTAEAIYALFPRLAERRRQGAGTLSGGEQQMLALGRALMTNPRLLLLDEPSEGLAPIIVGEIGRVIGRLKDEGLSILLVEQNVRLALRVADRVHVMSKGQIVYQGPAADLEADEDVKRRFLGLA